MGLDGTTITWTDFHIANTFFRWCKYVLVLLLGWGLSYYRYHGVPRRFAFGQLCFSSAWLLCMCCWNLRYAQGSFATLRNDFNELLFNKTEGYPEILFEEFNAKIPTPQAIPVDRAWAAGIADSVEFLNRYGCWCYFGSEFGSGHGEPIDEFDAICKNLHSGYECAIIDNDPTAGEQCIPWEVDYVSAQQAGGDGREQCMILNQDRSDCAKRACLTESIFIESSVIILLQGGSLKPEFKHSNGFDPSKRCVVKKEKFFNKKSERACCGIYPDRFPFKTDGGTRNCCGGRTYNTFMHSCCNAQVVQDQICVDDFSMSTSDKDGLPVFDNTGTKWMNFASQEL